MSPATLATLALVAGVACFVAGAGAVVLRAAGVLVVPLQTTTALAVVGLMLTAAGASIQRVRRGRR